LFTCSSLAEFGYSDLAHESTFPRPMIHDYSIDTHIYC
jgi:hypothetical protein